MEDRLMVDMGISADCTEMEAEDTVIPSKDARRGEWRLPRRGQKGFTIVEVLVALLILLATATMTAQLSIQAIHTSYSQQQRSTAMTLSLAGMEQVRSTVRGISGSEYFASLTKYYDESSSESVAKKLNEYGVLQIDGDFSDLKGDMSVVYAESAADTSGVSDPLVPSTVLNKNGTDYTINTAIGKCYRRQDKNGGTSTTSPGTLPGGGSGANIVCLAWNSISENAATVGATYLDPDLQSAYGNTLETDIKSATACPKGAFLLGNYIYSPMLRVTVAIEWKSGVTRSGKPQLYATTEYLDSQADTSLVIAS